MSDTGLLQDSRLGPLLFFLFANPLGEVIARFAVKFHQFADDAQIYLAFNRDKKRVSGLVSTLASLSLSLSLSFRPAPPTTYQSMCDTQDRHY